MDASYLTNADQVASHLRAVYDDHVTSKSSLERFADALFRDRSYPLTPDQSAVVKAALAKNARKKRNPS